MKKGRGVHVCNRNNDLNRVNKCRVGFKEPETKRHIEFNKDFQLFPTDVHWQRCDWRREAGCQCNIRGYLTGYCSPRREEIVYYSGLPTQLKQVYAYSRARSFTDVGVGSVMVQQKKRVRKIYLPETENRGVGSTDLAPLIKADKRHRYVKEDYPRYAREEYTRYGRDDFYFPKKSSSKCVGGAVDNIKQCTEKLSPIICYIRSKGTSPNDIPEVKAISKDTGNNTIDKHLANITTQVESSNERNTRASSRQMKKESKNVKEIVPVETVKSIRLPVKKNQVVDNVTSVRSPIRKFQESTIQKSSDSLEQHVHNLEDPSFIPSTGSSDPMENKLEKEYRRMFSAKNKDDKENTEKPVQDLKSTSLLRRRFEALRRGIAKKEDNKKKDTANANITESKDSNPPVESSGIVQSSGSPTRVDISVESDPPSLEARSYSQTKLFSPAPSAYNRRSRHVSRKKSHVAKKEKGSLNWPPADKKVDDSDVQGMFKMWGEKFNLEGSRQTSPRVSFEKNTKEVGIKIRDDEPKTNSQEKKEGKRFFFFKKKIKDKTKSPCKSKKGVTTGRCEVKNCLVLKGPPQPEPDNKYPSQETPKVVVKKSEDTNDIIKKNWLQKFIQRTIESRRSLQIRWNNKTYTTSSSTVFELMDNVYRQTEVIIRSQSETSTVASSYYQSYNRHHVNFVQDIEAWMVPKLERDVPYNFFRRNDHQIKDRKWFIDKSKAFAHKIELVLHSKNFAKGYRAMSSEYLRIDIPKGFFSDVSSESERFATSNSEEVYKIIEYESPESRSEIKIRMKKNIGENNNEKVKKKVSVRDKNTDTRVTETVIKKPPIHRDVVIQGSNVHIPKRCDVIGVGIITHRDIRELTRPILKLDDDVSDEESERVIENSIKQCEFAESYLREYYRNWMPLGIDIFSSCASDIYVKCETEESLSSINNQGDVTKSCPNLKDYNSTMNLDPASSNSCPYNPTDKSKIITTFKSLTQSEPPLETKRILPKDSFEVLKKRLLYACGNKAKWSYSEDQPYSVPSIQDKAEQDAINEICVQCKPRKKCMKRVSITNCDYPSGEDPIPFHRPIMPSMDVKPLPGILSFARRSSGSVTKHATINPDDVCDITPAACKEFCETAKAPHCAKPPPKPKPASKQPSKKSSSDSSSSSKKCPPPRKICSCTCTPKLSSPLISATCSLQPMKTLSPQNTRISPNMNQQAPNQRQTSPRTSTVAKPCTCGPNKPKPKANEPKVPKIKPCTCAPKDKKQSPGQSPQRSATGSPKRSLGLSPTRSSPPCISPKGSPKNTPKSYMPQSSTCSKESCKTKPIPCPAQQKKTETDTCPCKTSVPSAQGGTPPPCSKCFQKDHSQSSNTNYQQDKSNQPSQESLFSPLSSKSTHMDPNGPCPGSPCENILADIAKKAQSLPKMQGLHLKMKPAPNPPKCRTDCPKSVSKETVMKAKDNNKTGKDPPCDGSCPSDETMLITIKKQTPSTEEIREDRNIKVKDADGKTLYERRDYKADSHRETHTQQVLGEMYKVNRLSTQSSEKKTLKEDIHESSKSDASIANLIEISFGLKVTQGDKITEINLGDEQEEEMDKPHCKGCNPCNVDKSQEVFMTSGEAEPAVDNSNDKNDINIKIIIKNFKSKADKSIKNRRNDEFARKISEKFHTVSTGYSDIIPDNIDNMYSIHRTTVDLTTSKSSLDIRGDQDVSGDMVNSEMKTNIQEPIPKRIETDGELLEKFKVPPEEIEKGGSLGNTLSVNEVMQMQSETDKLPKTKSVEKLCKCITGEIKKVNIADFQKSDTLSQIQKTDTYAVLQTEGIKGETKQEIQTDEEVQIKEILKPDEKVQETNEKIQKSRPVEKIEKSDEESQRPDKEIHKPNDEIQRTDEEIQKRDKKIHQSHEEIQKPDGGIKEPDKEIQKSNKAIQKTGEDNIATIQKTEDMETCEIIHVSEIIGTKSDIDKRMQDTKSDFDNIMPTLMPVIKSIRDIEQSYIKKSKEDKVYSDIVDKKQSIENNKELPCDDIKGDKIETNDIKSKSELATDIDEKINIAQNDAVMSHENIKAEKIATRDIITKSELVNSILERITGTENDAVLLENYIQNEKIERSGTKIERSKRKIKEVKTSDIKQRSASTKEKSEIIQIIHSNENKEVIPRKSNETERIVVSDMMLQSESIKDNSKSGGLIDLSKNQAAIPENKSGIEKFATSITIELKLDARERIQSIENYEEIPENNTNFETENNVDTENDTNIVTENNTNIATIVTCETVQKYEKIEVIPETNKTITNDNDLLLSETIQVIENWQSVFDEKDYTFENYEAENIFEGLDKHKQNKKSEKQTFNDEIANEIKNFENFLNLQKRLQYPTDFHKPVEITPDIDICEESHILESGDITEKTYTEPDITEDEKNFDQENEQSVMPVGNEHIEYSETRLSHTDTDDQENNLDLANTSDDVYDNTIEIPKPHTKREKKEMLKHVFEKATSQKWKTKGRMKRIRNMLKFILTSDSSEVEEAAVTSKDLVKDVTYSSFDPNYFKATDSMTNYYRLDNVIPSDDENKMAGSYPTQEQSEVSESSDYQTNVSKCICNTMAERIQKRGDTLLSGCCCRSPPKVHEQTSCNITADQGLYMVNYKAGEYTDVQTQHSIINTRVTNVMVMKKMESLMTSKTSSEVEKLKVNSSVSPYRDDKECEARTVKTNTMLGLIDDGKIVIRTSDENKMSLKTEIVIGWKGKNKKKLKRRENVYFACPADILQSYETKKAVLEIYTEKTVSDEGEKLVAKLPKYLYDKEEEIENNYVKNVLLAHDKI